jgi:hypothetical protein
MRTILQENKLAIDYTRESTHLGAAKKKRIIKLLEKAGAK